MLSSRNQKMRNLVVLNPQQKITLMEEFLKLLQTKLSKLVELKPFDIEKIKKVCGVDVSYKKKKAAAVVCSIDGKLIEFAITKAKEEFPYIPGLLAFREGPIVLKAVEKLKEDFDLLLVDGHGYAHPRRAGLACIVGVLLDKPTIGVAKKLLIGKVEEGGVVSRVFDGEELIGYRIKSNKTFYVSPGHKVDFASTIKFFESQNYQYPKVLEIADGLSKREDAEC